MTTLPKFTPGEIVVQVEKDGLFARIKANHIGHYCGYIGMPADCALAQEDYESLDVEVHGGLTYGQVEEDGLYWVGFDCAHAGDAPHPNSPHAQYTFEGDVFRDIPFVKAETEKLGRQIRELLTLKIQ